jgi:hypothetical protein
VEPNLSSRIVITKLNEIIVLMALFDWPQYWEAFPFDVYPENFITEGVGNVHILDELIHQTLESPLISSERRSFLIEIINGQIPQIFEIVIPALSDSDKIQQGICLIRKLVKIAPMDLLLDEQILFTILAAFRDFDFCHSQAIELATELLIGRVDSADYFDQFGTRVLAAKHEIERPSIELAEFSFEFFDKFAVNFEPSGLYREELLASFCWTLGHRQSLRWKFWDGFVGRVKSEIPSSVALMTDLYPAILPMMLPYFSIRFYRRDPLFETFWEAFVGLNPGLMFSYFMEYPAIDIYMCYSMSATLLILPREASHELAATFYPRLFETISRLELSPRFAEFLRALLHAICKVFNYLGTTDRIGEVHQLIHSFLSTDIGFLHEGIIDLLMPSNLVCQFDDWSLPRFLSESLDLDKPLGYFLFQKLSNFPLDFSTGLSQVLAARLSGFVLSFPDFDAAQLNLTLKCLTKSRVQIFADLWPVVLQAATVIARPEFELKDTRELLVSGLIEGLTKCPFDTISPIISPILDIFADWPDFLYQIIYAIRRAHTAGEALWSLVETLVEQELETSLFQCPSFFRMVSVFSSCTILTGNVGFVSIVSIAIKSLDYQLVASALEFVGVILQNSDDVEPEVRVMWLNAIYESLTDMLHATSIRELSNAAWQFFQVFDHDPNFVRHFLEAFAGCEAAGHLFESLQGRAAADFLEIVRDFLVATRRITPFGLERIEVLEQPVEIEIVNASDGEDDLLLEHMRTLSIPHADEAS